MTLLSLNDISEDEGPSIPRSISRVFDLLETVVARGSCTLTEAAGDVELTPTTARRYLQALVARGYIERTTGGAYRVGPAVRVLARALDDRDEVAALARRAQPHLERLASTVGESVYLGVVDDDSIVYVATAQTERAIRHVGWIGQRLPHEHTAIGAALAAPGRPVFRSGGLEADISAVSHGLPGEWEGTAAISIVGPTHRFDQASIARFELALTQAVGALIDELRLEAVR
ncbi:MAG: IclR family transcriptional regulator [Acidimicrobiales bacterium]